MTGSVIGGATLFSSFKHTCSTNRQRKVWRLKRVRTLHSCIHSNTCGEGERQRDVCVLRSLPSSRPLRSSLFKAKSKGTGRTGGTGVSLQGPSRQYEILNGCQCSTSPPDASRKRPTKVVVDGLEWIQIRIRQILWDTDAGLLSLKIPHTVSV